MIEKKTTFDIWNYACKISVINKKKWDEEWVSVESMINELEKFETDVRYHFHKVTNQKLNTIRAINHIINKLRGE